MTQFLWFHDSSQPEQVEGNLDVYQFCHVPFGIICSLVLLEGTLKFYLHKCSYSKIVENVYVDNVFIGTDSAKETYQIYEEARNILKKASVNLQWWTSNSRKFIELT